MSEDRNPLDVIVGIVVLLLSPLAILVSPFWFAYKAFRTVIGLPVMEEKRAQRHHAMLYDAAKQHSLMSEDEFAEAVLGPINDILECLVDPVVDMIVELYRSENMNIPPPPPVANSLEGARYRDMLAKAPDLNRAARVLTDVTLSYLTSLPLEPDPDDLTFSGTVADFATAEIIESAVIPFYREEVLEAGLFTYTRRQLDRNMHEVSKIPYTLENRDSTKLVLPRNYQGEDAPYHYLKNTALMPLFRAEFPFAIPEKSRNEHCFIIGGSGHGKTTLLESMILHDLEDERKPSIVVVDSQGQLIDKISHTLHAITRDCVIIDPRDNPALNIFDINQKRVARYGHAQREQVYNHTLETFSYLFNSLLGAQLTVRQTTLFSNLIALMLALPDAIGRNATLHDLIRVMEKTIPADYMPAVQKLEPIARDFLLKDFTTSRYEQTKEEIRYRILNILGNKTLSRLFLAPNNTIDFHEELNKGSVILIDTTQAFLGKTNSSYLGRFAITIVLNAILERASSHGPHRPVYLFIDEAQEYFDKGIDNFLAQARKYRAGLTLATQDLTHVPAELRSSIFSNTSIKFAGGISSADARALASDMRTDVDFLLAQKKLNFACFVRNNTPRARSIKVEVGKLDKELQLDDETFAAYRKRNRERVAAPKLLGTPAVDEGTDSDMPRTENQKPASLVPPGKAPKAPRRNPTSKPQADPNEVSSDW